MTKRRYLHHGSCGFPSRPCKGHLRNLEAKLVKGSGCWGWNGATTRGYGVLRVNGCAMYAHRIMWVLSGRRFRKGYELDHLCRNRLCANPQHLQEVSHRANVLRGASPMAINARKRLCPKGHRYRLYGGYRICPTCLSKWQKENRRKNIHRHRERARAYYASHRASCLRRSNSYYTKHKSDIARYKRNWYVRHRSAKKPRVFSC